MIYKGIVIAAAVLVVIALATYPFFAHSAILRTSTYHTTVDTALHMNALYQLQNGYYTSSLNNSIEHSGNGALYDDPNGTMGFLIIRKRGSNCTAPVVNLTSCPEHVYEVNTRINLNGSGTMQLSTRVYRNKADAKEEFTSIVTSLNTTGNAFGSITIDDINSLGSDVGPYASQYAVLNEPFDHDNSSMYLHVLMLRRDTILLISQVTNNNQTYLPSISQSTRSTTDMSSLLNNYFLQ